MSSQDLNGDDYEDDDVNNSQEEAEEMTEDEQILFSNKSLTRTPTPTLAAGQQQKKDDVTTNNRKRKNNDDVTASSRATTDHHYHQEEGGKNDVESSKKNRTNNSKKKDGRTTTRNNKKQARFMEETARIVRKNLMKLGRDRQLDALTVQQLLNCGTLEAAELFADNNNNNNNVAADGDGGSDDVDIETPSASSSCCSDEDNEEDEKEEEQRRVVETTTKEADNNNNAFDDEVNRASGRSVTVNAGEVREPTMTNFIFNNLVAAQKEERKTTPWAHLKESYIYRVDHVQRFESMYGPCWVGTLLPVKPGGGGKRTSSATKMKKLKMPRVFMPKGFIWKLRQNYMPGKACYFKTLGIEQITLNNGQGFGSRKK